MTNFGFLRKYGLRPVGEDVTFVRYESDSVFVNIYHGRGSFEIGVEVGRLGRTENYGLDYIVSWAGKQAWEAEGFGRGTMFQVSSREGVQNIVPKVSELMKKYGDPFLSGRPGFYAELEKANEREQMLVRIREEAAAAWKAKQFSRVAGSLEPVRADLSEIESKRLAFAEKQARSAVHKEPANRG